MSDNTLGINEHPLDFLLNEEFNFPVAGEIRQGWVVSHRNNEIMIDVGAKSEGIIPNREVEKLDAAALDELAVGNEVTICVVEPEDQNGNLILSYTKAAEQQDWIDAQKQLKADSISSHKVIGFNRGGALVGYGQIRGFVPNSQIYRTYSGGNESDESFMQKLIGKTINLKVLEVDQERNRLILSQKTAEMELREEKRSQLLDELEEGDICQGRVVNLTDFGAFVDIGGMEGLVHLSELSWKRVNSPADVLQLGEEVKVSIISIDQERQRLALSLKRLEADPWSTIDTHYQVGQLIEATVTKLTNFGAFAKLNDDYELVGLIHISELAADHINHPRKVVKPSQVVTVRIIRIDAEQRQLGLSLKAVTSDKFIEADMEEMYSSTT